MAKETERKFLVKDTRWRDGSDEGATISQFYVLTGEGRTARVRVFDGVRARLTLKFGGSVRERDEFEYDIPLDDAQTMERFAIGIVIEKVRHRVSHGGHVYEVDLFKRALAGLVIAELETADAVADADLPAWIGREVTGEAAFYNVSLATVGMPEAG